MNKQKDISINGNRVCGYIIFCIVSCSILLLFVSTAFAREGVILRTEVTPHEIWVGQKAIMHVDVLAQDGWAQIKKSGDAQIRGAYMLRVETQGIRLSENIDGHAYTGQRYELLIFPQIAGRITVPPVPVDVEVKTWGANPETKSSHLSTQRVELNAKTPPGAEGIKGLISTTELTAEQKWDSDTAPGKTGDAIKRIITINARDVSGMAFTPLQFEPIEGVGVYPGEPDVSDKTNRGTLSGQRIEKVTYVFEQGGEFHLPEIVFFWWDIENNELKRIELPGKKFEIAGAPAIAEMQQTRSAPIWLMILVGSASVLIVALLFRGRLSALWKSWIKSRRERESVYFRRIIKAAQSGEARATLREAMRWIDKINAADGLARLDQFLNEHGDDQAKENAEILTHCVDNGATIPDIPALVKSFQKTRHQWKQSFKKRAQADRLLPELNG